MSKVLIYGGHNGIGHAVATELSKNGHGIHIAGRDETVIPAVAAELNASYTLGDARDPDFFIQASKEAGDALSGMVYAIGNLSLSTVGRLDDQTIISDFELHALGAFRAVKASLKQLKRSPTPASVVLFSSVAAEKGFSAHASMGLSKGAINGLTVSLAAELAPKIRVNAIAPSLTDTPLALSLLSNDKQAETIASMHPMKRLGTAKDIGSMAAFLLSENASWITGQVIGIDGGRSKIA